jgi:hypothetical protein
MKKKLKERVYGRHILDSVGLRFLLSRRGVSLVTQVGFKSVAHAAGHGRPVSGISARGPLTWFTASPGRILVLVAARLVVFVRQAIQAVESKVFVGHAIEAKPFAFAMLLFFA